MHSLAQTRALPNTACPLCGGPNGCAPAATGSLDAPCWCRDVAIDPAVLARIPAAQRNVACLCRQCATAAALTAP